MKKSVIMGYLKKNELVSFLLAGFLVLILATCSPYFFSSSNLDSLQTSIAPYGILAVGMTVLLASGVFDMSVGSVMCLGGLVTAICLTQGVSTPVAMLIGIAAGACIGLVNGLLVEVAGINPLITTIGMMYIARGISEVILVGRGKAGYSDFPQSFLNLGSGKFLGVYYMFWIMLILIIGAHLYLMYLPGGRRIYYLGGNADAARLMGIKTMAIRISAFVLSGALAAFAGTLVNARSGMANRYTGQNAHMDVVIACIIGGASLAGGQGSAVGALFGTIFMALMTNAFNLFEVAPQWQSICVGIILLLVIAVDGYVSWTKQKKLGKI